MKTETIRRNRIDFAFPLILFFLFSLCAVMLILFSARVYKKVVTESSSQNVASTAAAYITEKVHQSDVKDMVHIRSSEDSDLMNADTLILETRHGDDVYQTCIYFYNGTLRELFAKAGTDASPEAGAVLFELSEADFSLEDNLLQVHLTDTEGHSADSAILIHSRD